MAESGIRGRGGERFYKAPAVLACGQAKTVDYGNDMAVSNHFDKSVPEAMSYAILFAMPQLKNRRHEIFALELASGAPLVSAFLAAGYKDSYSARYNASRLRNDSREKERINELLQEHADRTAIKVEWVQNKIAPFLDVDAVELYEPSGDPDNPGKLELKPLTALPERLRKAITRIRVDPETGQPVEVWLVDKLAAANTLLRSLPGGSISRHEVSGPNGGPLEIGSAQLELLSEEQLLQLDVMTLQIENAGAETNESVAAGA